MSPPFYWIFNIKESLSPYKVVWKEIAGKISGKGQFMASVVPPLQDPNGKMRPIIPDQ